MKTSSFVVTSLAGVALLVLGIIKLFEIATLGGIALAVLLAVVIAENIK